MNNQTLKNRLNERTTNDTTDNPDRTVAGPHTPLTAPAGPFEGVVESAVSFDWDQRVQMALDFLSRLDPTADKFTFQTFPEGPHKNTSPRTFYGSLREHAQELERLNKSGAGVFVTVQRTDGSGYRKKDNIVEIRAVFQEDDGGTETPLPLNPHMVVRSSPGKHHRYILTEGGPTDEFDSVQRRLVNDYGSDPNAKDLARVLRLPGFFHKKDPQNPHLVQVIEVSDQSPLQWETVKSYFPPVVNDGKSLNARPSAGPLSANHADIEDALKYLDPDLQYHDWLLIGMAIHAADSGSDGLALWDNWSSSGTKYDAGELRNKWQGFDANREGGVTIGSLFKMARDNGWPGPTTTREDNTHTWRFLTFSDNGYPDFSHDQLALDLSNKYGWSDNARYVAQWSKWLFWDGTRWVVDRDLKHMTFIRDFLRDVADETERWSRHHAQLAQSTEAADKLTRWACNQAGVLRDGPARDQVARTARSNAELSAPPEQFDADPLLLGTPGGTLDLSTGTLRSAQPTDYITKHVAVAPADPGTDAPQWQAFLRKSQGDDPEMIAFLQRLCGYVLTGMTTAHKLPFIFGPGGNGKSVFANTLEDILQDYATHTPADTFLANRQNQHPTALAKIEGKRLVTASELPEGGTWNEGLLKDLTGGDPISARYMRQDFFQFTPECTVFLIGNNRPRFRAVDDAMRRRLLLIPFTQTISEKDRDPQLKQKLQQEHPAILRWMVDGALQWQRDGLNPPEAVLDASRDYLDDEDILQQFVDECLTFNPDSSVLCSTLYERFRDWCESQGRYSWTQNTLTRTLKDRGYPTKRSNQGNRVVGYEINNEDNGLTTGKAALLSQLESNKRPVCQS